MELIRFHLPTFVKHVHTTTYNMHLRMNLACQKCLGKITEVLGFGRPPPPHVGKNSQKMSFFLTSPLIQEILVADLFFFVWGFPKVFDGFPILRYDIWANSQLCFADLNTIEPREVEWQFSQSNSSSSCNRISYFLTLDLFQGMMQMDMAKSMFLSIWCANSQIRN